jgi:probable FeS assembly SUF system protein SufT
MDFTKETITVERDCDAILIPSGDPIKLIKGTHVRITQALGGDYTLFVNGNLVRISGTSADAIGIKQETTEKPEINYKPDKPVEEEQVWEQLRTVYDPEIPVNIVELGLVYDLEITPKEKGDFVRIKMTLTAPGCGMGPVIAQDAEQKIRSIPGVIDVFIEIVWEPLWDRNMMSDEAKLQMGMM